VRVLVVNAGSSSLKHANVEVPGGRLTDAGTERWEPDGDSRRHGDALREALDGAVAGPVDAVGHRVVHGGTRFTGPAVIDASVRAGIEELVPLAPLHQRAALEGIDAVDAALPGVPQVACFDTAFHHTLDPAAATYPVPAAWREEHGLRRFGFHGLNVEWCAGQARERLGEEGTRRLVVCHLGSGCSVTAVRDGRSVDTTMGFTPLEGVPMGTRSGSIDPAVVLWLARAGMPLDEIDDGLNHRSGLLGVFGRSPDLRDVLEAMDAGEADAELAFAIHVRGVAAAVAAMAGSLGGVDALVFSGGAGEHAPRLREAICARLPFLGVDAAGTTPVLVVPAGEEQVIARQTAALIG